MPNGGMTAIVQGLGRLKLTDITRRRPYLLGKVEPARELLPDKGDNEFLAAIEDLRQTTTEYVKMNDDIPEEASFAIKNVQNDVMALNFICSNMLFSISEKIREHVDRNMEAVHNNTTDKFVNVAFSIPGLARFVFWVLSLIHI